MVFLTVSCCRGQTYVRARAIRTNCFLNIDIGSLGKGSIGLAFQIRAFVNPGGIYEAIEEQERYVFDSWPEEAELSTEPVIVIRGAKNE